MFNTEKKLVTALLMASPFMTFSQLSISGKIKNKQSLESIAGATIRIDNTFIVSQSDTLGMFEIKNLKKGTYIF